MTDPIGDNLDARIPMLWYMTMEIEKSLGAFDYMIMVLGKHYTIRWTMVNALLLEQPQDLRRWMVYVWDKYRVHDMPLRGSERPVEGSECIEPTIPLDKS